MRSLVVFVSVLAMAAAISQPWLHKVKRSIQTLAYPPAVSHQSRFEVKTSQVVPASIAGEAAASLQARAVAPLVFVQPTASHQASVVSASGIAPLVSVPVSPRAVYAGQAHTLYAGGSAVTHQTRYDTASYPTVVSELFAAPVEAQPVIAVS